MAEKMGFTLDTHDCQYLVLALICHDSHVLKANKDKVNKLIELFATVNGQLKEENNYTAKVTVSFE